MNRWQPSASPELIRLRARTLSHIRAFFDARNILEVDTPVLSAATITDPFIESFSTRYVPLTRKVDTETFYLHTSPEFPMKRLLASGIGSIYQISKVFRQGECGQRHNPEFSLLEWYRQGWDHHRLMQEVVQLLETLLAPHLPLASASFISYRQAFEQYLGINPHCANKEDLIACAERAGLAKVLDREEHRDRYLELLFSHCIEASLGKTVDAEGHEKPCVCCLYHYPASQAALAKTAQEQGDAIAQRFEVFINGMELGNGFYELTDSREQRKRFEADNQHRIQAGQSAIPMDDAFLAALEHLPDCAGVALGIDRLLMVMSQCSDISDVIAFPFDRA